MKVRNVAEMAAWCMALTENGKSLAVLWNGGNDEGFFEMALNDDPIEQDSEIQDAILDLVAEQLGYGGFDGDFSSDGLLTFNRESCCFEGTDKYSESEINTIPCTMEVRLSAEIWFDQLEIEMAGTEDYVETITTRLILNNGPRIEAHNFLANQLNQHLFKEVSKIVEGIENFAGLSDDLTIQANDFIRTEEDVVFVITEFSYFRYLSSEKDITIYLTDKINEDVTF